MLTKMESGKVLLEMLQDIAKISYKRLHTDDDMAAIYARVGNAITVHLMTDEPNKHSGNDLGIIAIEMYNDEIRYDGKIIYRGLYERDDVEHIVKAYKDQQAKTSDYDAAHGHDWKEKPTER